MAETNPENIKTIRVFLATHQDLCVIRAELQMSSAKITSFDDAIRYLLKREQEYRVLLKRMKET